MQVVRKSFIEKTGFAKISYCIRYPKVRFCQDIVSDIPGKRTAKPIQFRQFNTENLHRETFFFDGGNCYLIYKFI